MAQASYTIIVKVNGQTLQATGVKIKFGGFRRELKTAAGVAGRVFTEIPEPSMVTCTLQHTDDGPAVDEIKNWKNVTLVLESDNGLTYQIDGAMVTNAIELGDEGSGISIEFGGPAAIQV